MTELMEYMVELTELLIKRTTVNDKDDLEILYTIKGNLTQKILEQNITPTDGFRETEDKV